MSQINIGVIGCGAIAQKGHLPWYWESSKANLLAVCSNIEDEARSVAERWKAEKWFTDYRQLLALDEIDAVSICTPVWLHQEITVAAAEAGKHVLCEKPMSRNSKEAKLMVDAASRNDVLLTIGFMKRFNPGFCKIKEIIDRGLIGRVYHIDVHWNLFFPPGTHESQTFSEDERIGGGVLLDNCSHYIDFSRWLLGSEVATVYSETSKVVPDRIYEDQATVILRFQDLSTSIMDMGFNRVEWVERSAWDRRPEYSSHFTEQGFIYGTEGTITFEAPPFDSIESLSIKVYLLKGEHCQLGGRHEIEVPVIRQPGGPLAPHEIESYPFKAQIEHFLDCIGGQDSLKVSGADGLIVTEVSMAAYESARTGKRITLA